jgi:predicted alpha/beta superfamily hydrolase
MAAPHLRLHVLGRLLLWAALAACGDSAVSNSPSPDARGDAGSADATASETGPSDAGSPAADAEVTADSGAIPRDEARLFVHYPAASLALRGDGAGLSWDVDAPMAATAPATFSVTVHFAATDGPSLAWKPRLNGVWARGPNYTVSRGAETHIYPHFQAVSGQVSTFRSSFVSAHTTAARPIYVYLPPTAIENTAARFPVVYMHDGQNLFDPRLSFGGVAWEVDQAVDRAAEDGSFAEPIVVGIGNSADRGNELTPTRDATEGFGGNGDAYLLMITDEIKPLVDAQFKTLPDRAHTAIVGSSLGGLISAHAGVKRSDAFGLVGALSPSTWWDNRVILREVPLLGSVRPLRVYVDSGDSGPSNDDVTNTAALASAWENAGYRRNQDLSYRVAAGDRHEEAAWQRRVPGAFAFLLGPGR